MIFFLIVAVIQGMSLRDLVILEGILRLDRRSISALKVFHNVLVSDSSSVWKFSLKEFMSALNCSQFASPKSLIFLLGCIGRPMCI